MVAQDRLLLDLWRTAWGSGSMALTCSSSIDEARREMEQQVFDIVVVDLPIEFAVKLAESQSRSATRIVVLVEENVVLPQLPPLAITTLSRSASLEQLLQAVRNTLGVTEPPIPVKTAGSILVVDDEESIRSLLAKFLSKRGYVVQEAGDGNEALRMIAANGHFDVILLDLSMPGMGGMETLAALKKSGICPTVIVLSGIADREIALSALKMGAFDYILKPFDLPALESAVSASLSHKDYKNRPWWKLRV